MNSHVTYVAVLVAFLVFVRSGYGLQCWECTSEASGRCGEDFNATLYPRSSLYAFTGTPRIVSCDGGPAQYVQVCMKKVETNRRFQMTTYIRSCHTLTPGEELGTCPTRTVNSGISVDFCEYCDTHECNGA